jgi:RimJ/RimL family protein N-acetyltransferase
LEDYLAALADPEVNRLTGSHAMSDRPTIETWLATRQQHHDRADWAAVRAADGAFLGEAVLNELDPDNESANYRVWLAGPHLFGQGYVLDICVKFSRGVPSVCPLYICRLVAVAQAMTWVARALRER